MGSVVAWTPVDRRFKATLSRQKRWGIPYLWDIRIAEVWLQLKPHQADYLLRFISQ
jgi:hypothetical protein